jgi:hypothetical protein
MLNIKETYHFLEKRLIKVIKALPVIAPNINETKGDVYFYSLIGYTSSLFSTVV